MPNELIEVVFRGPFQRYAAGERAGFQPAFAHDLVNRGIAVMAPEREDTEQERYDRGQEEKFRKAVMVEVVFLKPFRMYRAGEKAGFSEKYAADLVASKIAVFATDEKAPAELPEEPTNPKGEQPTPPWGDDVPELEQFVAYNEKAVRKDAIILKLKEFTDEVDEKQTKAALLEELYIYLYADDEDDGDGDADSVG